MSVVSPRVVDVTEIGEGQGFAGRVARVTFDYDCPDVEAPRTLIAKLAFPDSPLFELLDVLRSGEVIEVNLELDNFKVDLEHQPGLVGASTGQQGSPLAGESLDPFDPLEEIGRASCRERV